MSEQDQNTPRPCDHTSVGAIIRNTNGHVLTFARNTLPAGIVGPAGHIDDHGGPVAAITAEVTEEVGLTVLDHRLIDARYRPGVCRRPEGEIGHEWWLFEVYTAGELNPSVRETRDVRWRSPAELQQLAVRTIAYARGAISAEDFATDPGIEPVWISWFHQAYIINASIDDCWAVDQILRNQMLRGRR